MTGQTASKQILFYLNVHLFATIVSIEGVWEVGGRGRGTGIHPSPPNTHTHKYSTSRNGMRRKFVPGISLCNDDDQ